DDTMPSSVQKVLVVDDYRDYADSVAMLLRLHGGYEVRLAYDAEEAGKSAEQPPDVVMLDIGLPGKDGYHLCRELKARWPACRFVAGSGFASSDAQERANEAGFEEYLVKPVDPNVLHEVLGRLRVR